jgi:CheY-like chemotaxis protein
VEDEALARMYLADELSIEGFDVIEAKSGDEAHAMLRDGLKVDSVITDVKMPGTIDGLQLASWIGQKRPSVPVLVISGYSLPPNDAGSSIVRTFRKPYDVADIVATLHSLMT